LKKINNKKTRSSIIKIPELLAPAGSYFMAVEAFKNGADAVYLGLKSHNARVGCDNFSRPEYASIIEFAKKSGKKVYLTLNTIIKENEIYEIYETLQFIDRVRPDALIVQDPGIIRIVKQNFPSIQLHSSTQMGAHNSFSIKTFERMGISRIILERQLTIEEIRSILENTKTEIEVFIHGALCCSLSGKCLFSSWLGGYSGNRGRCKQPCRRRFHGTSGNGFFFSTRDLCGLENLLDLAACKVSSFKIEGRLRGIDYVSKTVKAYRMLLDSVPFKSILAKTIEGIQPEPEEVKQYKLCLKASGALLGSLPSRTWSGLFKSSNDFKDMVKHEIMGVQGR
jgi:putative protease